MYRKIITLIHLLFIILLLSYVFIVYFSEDISIKINKSRNNYSENINNRVLNIPLLENDTENVINFVLENNSEKKIKKRYFWNLLKNE